MSYSQTFSRLSSALAERYRIERELGHGGMATVFLAQDVKHDRLVAIKVLRSDIAATVGAERFLREVRIAAALAHPHIVGLHDSGVAGDFLYYVMPYVEGESLRQRLSREGDLPVFEALRIVREIVDALAYAHAHGVVHRDIKPDNILLTGRHAVVTDFGVAKAVSDATVKDALTTAGVALGTPTYMAPEQASADPHVDHRADLYAVGVVAYELLAGRPPISGTSPQHTLIAHITETPRPLSEHRPNLPPGVEHFVMRCLEKRPSDRWQSADDMLDVLDGLATPTAGMTPAATMPLATRATPTRLVRPRALVTGSLLILGGAAGSWHWYYNRAPTVVVSNTRQLTRGTDVEIEPVVSPGAGEVAYVVWRGPRFGIHVLDIAGGRPIELAPDRQRTVAPRWSSDGRSVAFFDADAAGGFVLPRFGGQPRRLAPGRFWDYRRGMVASVRRDSVFITGPEGSERFVVATVKRPYAIALSPDGKRVAFATGNPDYHLDGSGGIGNIAPSTIWTVRVEGGSPIAVTDSQSLNTGPVWLPDGRHLLFVSNRDGPRDLYVQRLDGRGKPRGPPSRVTTGLDAQTASISADGSTMVYARLIFRRNIWAVPLPSTGTVSLEQAKPVTTGNQVVESHGVSADGTRLVFDANLDGGQGLFVVPAAGGEPRRLTSTASNDFHPDLSPDGREIVFYSTRMGTRDLFIIDANGGNVRRLTDMPAEEYHPAFSPDGSRIAFGYQAEGHQSVWVLSRDSLSGDWSKPRQVSPAWGWAPRWLPDGQRLVTTARAGIAILSLDGRQQTLVDRRAHGLLSAAWPEVSPDGRFVYFVGSSQDRSRGLYVVPISGGAPRLVVRFDDPTKVVWPIFTIGRGVAYLTVAEYESDIFVTDLAVR